MEWNWLWHCSSLYKTPHRQDDFQAFMLRWKKYPNASKTRPRLSEHSENIWTFRVQACRLLSYVSFALFFHVRECVPLSALPQWPQIFWSSEASVTKRPAETLSHLPFSVAKCSDLSRSWRAISHILFHHLATVPRGATAKLAAPRLPKPCPGQAESTLTSDAFTTEEGKRKYQRLPSLFPPVLRAVISAAVSHLDERRLPSSRRSFHSWVRFGGRLCAAARRCRSYSTSSISRWIRQALRFQRGTHRQDLEGCITERLCGQGNQFAQTHTRRRHTRRCTVCTRNRWGCPFCWVYKHGSKNTVKCCGGLHVLTAVMCSKHGTHDAVAVMYPSPSLRPPVCPAAASWQVIPPLCCPGHREPLRCPL